MKRRVWTLGVSLCALIILGTSPARADLYFGGSVGQGSSDVGVGTVDDGSLTSGSVDDSSTGWKVYGGYKMFKFFAIEAAWTDVGETTISAVSDGSGVFSAGAVTGGFEANGYTVSTLGVLPIGTKVQLFAKVGYFFWDADMVTSDTSGSVSASTDGEDPLVGAGVVWDYAGMGSLRVEYEQMDVDTLSVDSISAGLSFRF